ncbi:ornithine carbamoyltransferase [Trichosporon asahii var. asahii CBS 2479]|uniref:ornithine carbamoyltransferase n=1 Tax=Trichosporon asahii var. asahii (strain ATCC 90039 / CBS 2479 / JCM 2466 / KCTC 7840 / NBRC 103889/ NCYC 2677 / UAMH 7654) TaxID=1186058 RepID=J4UIX0_TRIAS|nr:ornithine carbamoyltransferase [Trichosporon asahii var. asahii CBS 2479]EJT51665.1 ornithine carbamoyltransferase [Trichosporon asahii var. asahii CBS 2479]
MLALRSAPARAAQAAAPAVRALSTSSIRCNDRHQTWDRPTVRAEAGDRRPQRPRAYNQQGAGASAQNARLSPSEVRDQRRERQAEFLATRQQRGPPHLLTLADYSAEEIADLVKSALAFKVVAKKWGNTEVPNSLQDRTVALMFSKRSTRTRVASETSVAMLGGHAMFLGSQDIQLGVNESLRDTATVVGSMVDGIMARVKGHDEVETLAKYSPVPIVNALSDLYHPTQILADLLTLVEMYHPDLSYLTEDIAGARNAYAVVRKRAQEIDIPALLNGKKFSYVGDTNNMSNEFIVSLPRLGMEVAIASPEGYNKIDPVVWKRVQDAGTEGKIQLTTKPEDALKDADLVVTDTWISMGQEEETAKRLEAFKGYQLTNALIERSGAKPDWKFMHCLPRHKDEVDDEVFYGPRSVVFPEAENRKWTILAVFNALMGRWQRAV